MPDGVGLPDNEAESEDELPPGHRRIVEPPVIAQSEWKDIWPGSEFDWSSPDIPVQLYVELPFWLMMPEGTFDVQYEASTLKVSVVHGCEEIHRSVRLLKNRASVVFIARPSETIPSHIQQIIDNSKSGLSVHVHRTTLIIETTILESVLKKVSCTDVERSQAYSYMSAMAIGHIPLINKLIAAYRRTANDPFVQEVTEATVTIWFLRFKDHFLRVSVFPYAELEYRPDFPIDRQTIAPANLATIEEVVDFLAFPETPGETILLDAWSYFYSGRLSDTIRGLVTALEVLLEAKYSAILKAHGNSDEVVQAALRSTATKFSTRFKNYLQLSKRTIPGPLLSWVPYINGTRLRGELNQTRSLRHKIVHEGHSMSPHDRGPMLRAVETMTWLFDWLEDNARSSRNRFKLYELKGMLRGQVQFEVEYATGGIRVLERQEGPLTEDDGEIMVDDQLWGKHGRALYGPEKDFALFAKLSLACVFADNNNIFAVLTSNFSMSIQDNEIPTPLPGITPERFRCNIDGVFNAIFLVELDGELVIPNLNGVMVRLLQLRVEFGGKRVHGICIVNHQQHLAPVCRESYRSLSADLSALLASCDLSLVFASDLARYIRGASHHDWPLTPLRNGMKGVGYFPCFPPNSTFAGEVVKVFPKRGVLGVNIEAEPALDVGDLVLIRTAAGFEAMFIETIMEDKKPIESVNKGLVGLRVSGDVKQISDGAFVFRSDSPIAGTVSTNSGDPAP